jgi:hypothetical protein
MRVRIQTELFNFDAYPNPDSAPKKMPIYAIRIRNTAFSLEFHALILE